VQNINAIIQLHKPPVVCFVGKVTYQKFSGLKTVEFGWQPDIGESKIYVMHFPIRGEAAVRIEDLKIVAKAAGLHGF
jgi:TDG/mug DNA glycosylase family protein